MPALALDVLKYAFLIVLYLFIARAVRAIYLELKPQPSRPAAAPAPAREARRSSTKPPRKIAIVEGGSKGQSFDLGEELVIGRGDKCHIPIDDSYASQVHARVFARDGTFAVEDLGSTNGTYLNGRRITTPQRLQRGDRIQIGKTVIEVRK